jgi:cellulose biosynthesis protein BcsQ
MRRTILAAAKGGCTKSTTAVNVAAGFALAGRKVGL